MGDSDSPLIEDQQALLAGGIKPNKFEGLKSGYARVPRAYRTDLLKDNQPSAFCLLPSASCLGNCQMQQQLDRSSSKDDSERYSL